MNDSFENKIEIILTDRDEEVHEFMIDYNGQIILINCKLKVSKNTLFIEQTDIEGAGPNTFGIKMKKVINEIAFEFCKLYKTDLIEISGAMRTAGRTRGTHIRTIKHDFTGEI